ncbi:MULTISPECIES: energy-coupling factor transporter ATPase [unclassified Fusibacter]|uniref:energy-coupling factor transporter ATPase n=1 Tax=unclassified Fusibacter TaxID=2624464 RepID=UPI001013715D|nr:MULTISPECIES: energy-coupling factor transporter ATPase [unclassified Fusibacter]MCK8061543.1 energy-coupling factor transporter ATPase [Fusibacter sp. A2]NPE23729.1 energy-coupling factor transporter ATPase [Fusibacter sp. A1]RXV58756.1 energy-coupling factor transporter ATPase [Fusibacter sp. A1]
MDKIKIENTTFKYEHSEHLALEGIDLHVKEGEFLAILGHNGSGKSTLAKMINALLLPTTGSVWVDGMNTADDEVLWDIRRTAGMVFQNPDNQIIATIVEEDVAFGPENLGLDQSEIIKRVDFAIERVDMTAYRHKPPHLLSGGQKQRISIAGVLAMKPSCIIFDEPTAMLDPSGRKEVMDTIMSLHKEGITVVLITHFMEEAVKADRVVVMHEGKIVKNETPMTLFQDVDSLKALSLDVPEVVGITHELRKMGIKLPKTILDREQLVNALCQYSSTK